MAEVVKVSGKQFYKIHKQCGKQIKSNKFKKHRLKCTTY